MTVIRVVLVAAILWTVGCSSPGDGNFDAVDAAEDTAVATSRLGGSTTTFDQPRGVPVARQFPWGPDEDPIIVQRLLPYTDEGTYRFVEPGCLVWRSAETGAEFAVLALPGTTYADGKIYDQSGHSADLGAGVGHFRWRHRDELQDSGNVDPATPLAEMCPDHERVIATAWREPPKVDNEVSRFLQDRYGSSTTTTTSIRR